MAFIQIISLPGGNGATCTKYYFKNGPRVNNKKWIAVGEVAEVPDEELSEHLASGKVIQVMGPNAAIHRNAGDLQRLTTNLHRYLLHNDEHV